MADEDLTLSGHVAFARRYVIEWRALAHAAPNIAPKLRQIERGRGSDREDSCRGSAERR